jgi:hypothetical protein
MTADTDPPRLAESAPDTSRETIDIGTPERLKDWATKLGVPAEALQSAVQAVGPRLDRVKDYLLAGQAGDQEGG